jgi:hypothetical protein
MSVPRGFIGTGVSSQVVHEYRYQSTESSLVQVSVHGVFMDTGVSPQWVHG